jgi:hypothetical protein
MGSGFNNPPEGPVGALPDITVPNYTQQAQQLAAGMEAAGSFDAFFKRYFEHIVPGFSTIIALIGSMADTIFSAGLDLLGKLQAANTPGFFNLITTALTDLTGMPFSQAAVQSAFQSGGVIAANADLGGQFLSMLTAELNQAVKLPQGPGVTAAAAWLGYGLNFAIREGNVEMLVQALPEEVRVMEGLRGYGVAIAEALGLGRLTRLVMQPFLKVLIQDPLTYDLNTAYTPTMLPVTSLFKANWRGDLSAADLNTALGKLGYSPAAIAQLQIDAATLTSNQQWIDMLRTQYTDAQTATDGLVVNGIAPTTVPQYLLGVEASRAATHFDSMISAYQTLLRNRWISYSQMQADLTAYGISAKEIQAIGESVAPLLEYTTHELSSSEIEDAYLKGLVDLPYYADWATRQGYSLPDQQILQYLLLLKQSAETTADQIAQWRLHIAALNAVAKGQPPPPGFNAQGNPT